MPTSGSISLTACSRSDSSSRIRIRAGCPSVLKNSAFAWYNGRLTRHPRLVFYPPSIANFSNCSSGAVGGGCTAPQGEHAVRGGLDPGAELAADRVEHGPQPV